MPPLRVLAAWLLSLGLFWLLFVASTHTHELIVGFLCVVAAAAFLCLVYRSEDLRLLFRLRDVLQCWRIPGELLSGSWQIVLVLIKDLLSIERAGSFYRVCGFRTAKAKPEMVARRVLATAYTSITPNSIVIGIDYTQSRLLFHQMLRSPLSKTTIALGAQVGGRS